MTPKPKQSVLTLLEQIDDEVKRHGGFTMIVDCTEPLISIRFEKERNAK